MKNSAKIHFINRIDKENAGDWSCCPLPYFYSYFKQFSLIRHDIDFINYNEISKRDVVILGGSGMINVTVSFNNAINKILHMCDNVVMWAGGFNTHGAQWFQGQEFPEIDFELFSLIGIRDYQHPSGIEYLPCPSVLAFPNPNLDEIQVKGKYGVIEHKDLPIKALLIEDKITNNASMETIYTFIRSHEAILTNSYHCAYWTMILGRKAIVVNKFSTKFDFFKYKPEFIRISEDDSAAQKAEKIEKAFADASIYLDFYDEAVEENYIFFEKVKKLVENTKIPRNQDYQSVYQLTVQQLWNTQAEPEKIRSEYRGLYEDMCQQFRKFDGEIHELYHCLHKELYKRLNQSHGELCEQQNCLHDEFYHQMHDLHDEIYERINCLHDEMYEQMNCLYDKIHEQMHFLQDDIYAKLTKIDECVDQMQLLFEEEKNKTLFKRFCSVINAKSESKEMSDRLLYLEGRLDKMEQSVIQLYHKMSEGGGKAE